MKKSTIFITFAIFSLGLFFFNYHAKLTQAQVKTDPCPILSQGDANCDSFVDDNDYVIWKSMFKAEPATTVARYRNADFDNNKKVDLIDFEIWREHRFEKPLPQPTDEPTPPCQCDLWAVTENSCIANTIPFCTGKFSCECRGTPTPTINPNISPTPSTSVINTPTPTAPPSGNGYTVGSGKIYKNGAEI